MADKKEIVDLTGSTKKICGVDCGTMNIVCAHQNDKSEVVTQSMRNVYLPIDKAEIGTMDLTQMSYVEDEDNIYIIGEDAYRYANIFGSPVKRPMKRGLISISDVDSLDVLAMMVGRLVGKVDEGLCIFSVPANSIDIDNDIIYHTNVYMRIFSQLGYKSKSLNEAMAVIYSECAEDQFSGLAFSFGAGMSNSTLSFRGNPVLQLSVARGGDWIDESVAKQFATVPNRITSIKENNTDLSDYKIGKKKERMIREAIVYYYTDLIRYTLNTIKNKIYSELSDVDLPESIPVIVSGGTSKAKGFLDLFKSIIENDDDIPFDIKRVVYADDPMTAVSEGCLIKALAED